MADRRGVPGAPRGRKRHQRISLEPIRQGVRPNEHPQQDDQLSRARFAEHQGLGACVRAREIYRLSACVERLLAPPERRRIARRCAALERGNGAVEVACMIEEMAYSRKVDHP
jgi:hypothetical protein